MLWSVTTLQERECCLERRTAGDFSRFMKIFHFSGSRGVSHGTDAWRKDNSVSLRSSKRASKAGVERSQRRKGWGTEVGGEKQAR